MLGWLGDLGRLSWGLVYWNARKSVFRMRGACGAAPCQHPSDSGAAGETGCEACRGWSDKGRFTRLCPLLTTNGEGRAVCSVSAGGVRPFWGRAGAFYGGALASLAAAAVLGVFVAFRFIGYHVPITVIAWPPAWHRIDSYRADYFFAMARRSFAAGDPRTGYLALNQVYALDPGNLAATRMLAQISQVANPDFSDGIYTRLLDGHGPDEEDLAAMWFRAMLARGDLVGSCRLAARMLRQGAKNVPAWTEGVVFADRMGSGGGEIDALLAGPTPLPPEARAVLSMTAALRAGSVDQRLARVQLLLGGECTAYEFHAAIEALEALGHASQAVELLEGPSGASVSNYDREKLKLDAYADLGWGVVEEREISGLLAQGNAPPVIVLISGHLIRHPNAAAAKAFFELLDGSPPAVTPANLASHTALLCLAGANGLDARVESESRILGKLIGGSLAGWQRVREFFTRPSADKNPAEILPGLSELPLELVYALIAHYHAAPQGGDEPAAGSHSGPGGA